jgi:hypothetical protein
LVLGSFLLGLLLLRNFFLRDLFDYRWSGSQLKQDENQQDYDYRQNTNQHRKISATHFFSPSTTRLPCTL